MVLPSDTESIKYLSKYGNELHQISGDNTLVLAFSKNEFTIPGTQSEFPDLVWTSIVEKQVAEGLSLRVANMFNIKYSEFPCLLLFEDIRSPQHVKISIKGLSAEEISVRMREIFSVIQKAVKNKEKVITTLKKDSFFKGLQAKSMATINVVQDITQKTFEAALTAWAETIVK